jgi:O-acetyl-ADP-ribose deacetylase (regulator of RNase III)
MNEPVRHAVGSGWIELGEGDITRQETAAIVNAANSALAGGGGVDGAIHRAAGPELMDACRKIGRCPTGSAVMTPGFRLPARFVLHAVGPVWRGGTRGEPDLLRAAYRSCLETAAENSLESISFPSISTGAYGYPMPQAARIALEEARRHLETPGSPLRLIRFVLFGRDACEIFARVAGEVLA